MFISSHFKKTDRCDILTQIDRKLSEMGEKIYHKYAFGVKGCTSTSDTLILSDLREILVNKINGHDCYREYNQKEIENIIKRYLY